MVNCSGGVGSRQHSKAAERLGEQVAKGMQKQWVKLWRKKVWQITSHQYLLRNIFSIKLFSFSLAEFLLLFLHFYVVLSNKSILFDKVLKF